MSNHTPTVGFCVQRSEAGEVQILKIRGRMSNGDFARVELELEQVWEQGCRKVILDLSRLSYATTMSLARLLVCAREFRQRGCELKLAGLSPWLKHLAELAGFERERDFSENSATASQAMSPPVEASRCRLPTAKS